MILIIPVGIIVVA